MTDLTPWSSTPLTAATVIVTALAEPPPAVGWAGALVADTVGFAAPPHAVATASANTIRITNGTICRFISKPPFQTLCSATGTIGEFRYTVPPFHAVRRPIIGDRQRN